MANSPPSAEPRARRLPAWAWVLLLPIGFVHLRGLASEPMLRDEPRLALGAEEMIHRGDYAVPRVLGEPDAGQSPLQSWLIVLVSVGQASRVGPLTVRLPSVLAVAATALVLARLGMDAGSGAHALPALVFLTFAVLPRYGRTGEPDLLSAFWVVAALATFELGRRRGSDAVRWVLAQALVAFGILTQAVAAVFFHVPALVTCWRRKLRLGPVTLAVGFALMLAIVSAWVAAYGRSAPTLPLQAQLSADVARHTASVAPGELLRHIARSLFLQLLTAAPASLVLLALVVPRVRAALRGPLQDPWLALCAFAVAWAVVWIALLPGAQPRELVPALPAVATLAAAALARIDRPARLAGSLVGLGLLAIAAAWPIARGFGAATAALLVAGVLYGLVTVRETDVYAARRHLALSAAAEALAPYLRSEMPVVVRRGIDRELAWLLGHRLDRIVVERAPTPPYDLVARSSAKVPNARLMLESGGYSVWRVRVPSRP